MRGGGARAGGTALVVLTGCVGIAVLVPGLAAAQDGDAPSGPTPVTTVGVPAGAVPFGSSGDCYRVPTGSGLMVPDGSAQQGSTDSGSGADQQGSTGSGAYRQLVPGLGSGVTIPRGFSAGPASWPASGADTVSCPPSVAGVPIESSTESSPGSSTETSAVTGVPSDGTSAATGLVDPSTGTTSTPLDTPSPAVPLVAGAARPDAGSVDQVPAQVTDRDCKDFPSQQAAQDYLNAHPADKARLDGDNDGRACQDFAYPAVLPGQGATTITATPGLTTSFDPSSTFPTTITPSTLTSSLPTTSFTTLPTLSTLPTLPETTVPPSTVQLPSGGASTGDGSTDAADDGPSATLLSGVGLMGTSLAGAGALWWRRSR